MVSQKNFNGYDAIIAEKVSQLQYFQNKKFLILLISYCQNHQIKTNLRNEK